MKIVLKLEGMSCSHLHISFQPHSTPLPWGYHAECGGGGSIFNRSGIREPVRWGFTKPHKHLTRQRTHDAAGAALSPGLASSLVHLNADSRWRLSGLPAGTYQCTITVGDPSFPSRSHLVVCGAEFGPLALPAGDLRQFRLIVHVRLSPAAAAAAAVETAVVVTGVPEAASSADAKVAGVAAVTVVAGRAVRQTAGAAVGESDIDVDLDQGVAAGVTMASGSRDGDEDEENNEGNGHKEEGPSTRRRGRRRIRVARGAPKEVTATAIEVTCPSPSDGPKKTWARVLSISVVSITSAITIDSDQTGDHTYTSTSTDTLTDTNNPDTSLDTNPDDRTDSHPHPKLLTLSDPAECAVLGEQAATATGLRYSRFYDSEDGVAGICWQSPGFDHPAHHYSASELIFGLEGTATTLTKVARVAEGAGGGVGGTKEVVEEEEWVPVEAGQCIVPGPMVSHRTKTDASSPYTCLYVNHQGGGGIYYSSSNGRDERCKGVYKC